MFPKSLIRHIAEEYPPYQELQSAHQRIIAQMLWMMTQTNYRHLRYTNAIGLPRDLIRGLWVDERIMQRVIQSNYFAVLIGDNFSGYCSAYFPEPYMCRALIKTLEYEEPEAFIDIEGDTLMIPKNPILSRSAETDDGKKSNSKWKGVRCKHPVPINIESLDYFASTTENSLHQMAALRILKDARNISCFGQIPVLYEQKKTGRISEILSGLQSTPREVVRAAFAGAWDYDISNCHFAILSEWAKNLGQTSPIIDFYLTNKKKVRQELAIDCKSDLGLDEAIKLIKKCLLSLVYGAVLNDNESWSSIGKTLGKESANKFISNQFVKNLKAEIRSLQKIIIIDLPKHAGRYGNKMGIYTDEKDPKKLLSHALQGAEAMALKSILEHFGEHILLCMHDGWISEKRLKKADLERVIKTVTGFSLEVEEVQIQAFKKDRMHSKQPKDTQKDDKYQLIKNDCLINDGGNTSPPSVPSIVLSARPSWNCPKGVKGLR
jgi:hypothetical protein